MKSNLVSQHLHPIVLTQRLSLFGHATHTHSIVIRKVQGLAVLIWRASLKSQVRIYNPLCLWYVSITTCTTSVCVHPLVVTTKNPGGKIQACEDDPNLDISKEWQTRVCINWEFFLDTQLTTISNTESPCAHLGKMSPQSNALGSRVHCDQSGYSGKKENSCPMLGTELRLCGVYPVPTLTELFRQ